MPEDGLKFLCQIFCTWCSVFSNLPLHAFLFCFDGQGQGPVHPSLQITTYSFLLCCTVIDTNACVILVLAPCARPIISNQAPISLPIDDIATSVVIHILHRLIANHQCLQGFHTLASFLDELLSRLPLPSHERGRGQYQRDLRCRRGAWRRFAVIADT